MDAIEAGIATRRQICCIVRISERDAIPGIFRAVMINQPLALFKSILVRIQA